MNNLSKAMLGTSIASVIAGLTTRFIHAAAAEENKIIWAEPNPYTEVEEDEKEQIKGRFLDPAPFRNTLEVWNLSKLLKSWEESDGTETWPWIWTWHNKDGPHAIYIGVDQQTLKSCQQFADESPQHNLTLVASMEQIEAQGLTEADFYKSRCAIIDSAPKQIDMENRILMLEDERLICYDVLQFGRR